MLSGPSRAGCEGAKASGDSDAGASAKAAWPTGKRGSSMWRELAHSPALVSGFVVWLLMSARVLLLVSEPSDRYIGAVPDDAFYYFQLARNFSRFGRWTFDGVAPSTGFHPLYAYLLAGSGLVGPDADPRRLLLVVGLASSAAIGASAALGASTASRVLGWQSAPWVTAVFVTPLALDQATMLLETWLACLFAAVVVHRIFASRQISRTVIVTVAVAGVLGSLTRTDFVVLTAGIVLGLALTTHAQVDRRRLGAAAVTLGGAVVGLALVAVQNITIAGKPVQASIVVKAYWNQVAAQGTDPLAHATVSALRTISKASQLALPTGALGGDWFVYLALLIPLLAIAATVGTVLRLRRVPPTRLGHPSSLTVSCFAVLVGFVAVYSIDGAVQRWYASNLLIPTALLLACIASTWLGSRVFVIGMSVCVAYLAIGLTQITHTEYPWQTANLRAGLALREQASVGTLGSWNAGILGFESDRGVVNLDGLVNDDAVPYVLSGRLDDYIRRRGVTAIVDTDAMLTDQPLRRQGGYENPLLVSCLAPPTELATSQDPTSSRPILRWQIRPGCLGT